MNETIANGDRYADFRNDPSYERRVVIFYDVLGWRDHIERAGSDIKAIGSLRRLILRHSRVMQVRTTLQIKASTFSDNVVITQTLGEKTQMLIQQMAIFQVASAMGGYLLRGGITIGNVIHEDEVVFGPGLNRAYELESKIARFPRFVLDPNLITEFGNLGDLPVEEQGVTFLDPFTLPFCEHLRKGTALEPKETFIAVGLPPPTALNQDIDRFLMLEMILDSLKPQIRGPTNDGQWEKLAWLYDRVAKQLGRPGASSYPRVKREDAG